MSNITRPHDSVSGDTARNIIEYAKARGVVEPLLSYRKAWGWELRGQGRDAKDRPLVWLVVKELGIAGSTGNVDQHSVTHPDRAKFPPKPWQRAVPPMTPDTDHPIQPEETKRVYSPSQLKQQKLLEELTGALEILPDIIESLTEYTVESLEPYAHRIVLATVLLQTIEARLYPADEDDEDDEEDEDNTELDGDAGLWDQGDTAEPSEAAKDAAVMALAASAEGSVAY